jgi:hypothetical protein
VFLRLQTYKKTSLKAEHCQNLASKFYGPYTILKHLGQVSYQLDFPIHSKLHPIFHVSCLKKVIGAKCQIQTNVLELAKEGSIWLQPEVVLDQREHRLHQRTIKDVLVQWKDTTPIVLHTFYIWYITYQQLLLRGSGVFNRKMDIGHVEGHITNKNV